MPAPLQADSGYLSVEDSDVDIQPPPQRSRVRLALALAASSCVALAALSTARGGASLARASVRGSSRLWQGSPDQYWLLGPGACVDHDGNKAHPLRIVEGASVLEDGSSPECEESCSDDPECTGYMTHDTEEGVWEGSGSGKCGIITGDFQVVNSDGTTEGSKCFWRKEYVERNEKVYNGTDMPIPKVIWSFWADVRSDPPYQLPPFVDMCVRSWRRLNPDYEVRVLNSTTLWKWLVPKDLPPTFKDLSVVHQADLIRLAVMAKHGGVWLDASVFMLRPMSEILSGRRNERTFFHMPEIPGTDVGTSHKVKDVRVLRENHPFTWFLSAPPGDNLIERTQSCVLEVLSSETRTEGLAKLDMFSDEELDEMPAIGLGQGLGRRLIVDACMFKTVYEDLSMDNWWWSSKVRHINPVKGLDTWWWTDLPRTRRVLFHEIDEKFASELVGSGVYALPFDSMMRQAVTDGVKPKVLWCTKNTWHFVLDQLGMTDTRACSSGAFTD